MLWASDLGADSKPYFLVYNGDADKDGSYEVMVGNPE